MAANASVKDRTLTKAVFQGAVSGMNWDKIFGGSPLGVVLRLALISIAVGIVMNALGIELSNFFHRINVLLRNIYDLGLGAFEWLFEYLLLGALVVIPIWLISRMIGATRRSRGNTTD